MVPPDSLTCESARALQTQLLGGEISVEDRSLLSQHNRECAQCAQELHESLAAGLRGKQLNGSEERWAIRHAYARARWRSSGAASGGKRIFVYLLIFALFLYGISMQWFSGGSPRFAVGSAQLNSVYGEVHLSGILIPVGQARTVSLGQEVELGNGSSARLVRGEAQIELADSLILRMEGNEPLAVDLAHGWTRCSGPCRVRTPLGLVILDEGDEVLIHVTESLVTLEGMGGETVATSAALTQTISRGEVLRFER
jgi:hypothetical protein